MHTRNRIALVTAILALGALAAAGCQGCSDEQSKDSSNVRPPDPPTRDAGGPEPPGDAQRNDPSVTLTGSLRIFVNAHSNKDDLTKSKASEAMDLLVTRFWEQHPGVTIEVVHFPYKTFPAAVDKFLGNAPADGKESVQSVVQPKKVTYKRDEKGKLHRSKPADANPADIGTPDVFTWRAGYLMRQAANGKKLRDITDEVWTGTSVADMGDAAKSAITVDEKQYGVPYALDHWALVYRRDRFKTDPPQVRDEQSNSPQKPEKKGDDKQRKKRQVPTAFQILHSQLKHEKDNPITLITIGTEFEWPAAPWFQYLTVRLKGRQYYQKLMSSEILYDHEGIKDVMRFWNEEIIARNYFIKNAHTIDESMAAEYLRGDKNSAAMYLLPSKSVAELDLSPKNYGLLAFPAIQDRDSVTEETKPGDTNAELTSTWTLHIPASASNSKNALAFLKLAADKDIQTDVNGKLEMVPAHRGAKAPNKWLLQASADILSEARWFVQDFQNDSHAKMRSSALKAFKDFMRAPRRLDSILNRLAKRQHNINTSSP